MIIDPLKITEKHLPLIVLSDDMRSFFSWGIKAHTRGLYSHAMMMLKPGKFVTQGWTYKEVNVEKYMKPRYRLKFWSYPFTEEEKSQIRFAVEEDLSRSWWHKSYDWIGIIGQLFRIRKLNNPFKSFCSERVAKYLRLILLLKNVVPLHPSPSQLNEICKAVSKFKVFGHWITD